MSPTTDLNQCRNRLRSIMTTRKSPQRTEPTNDYATNNVGSKLFIFNQLYNDNSNNNHNNNINNHKNK